MAQPISSSAARRLLPRAILFGLLAFPLLLRPVSIRALPEHLGDLDEDGRPTILDLSRLANHLSGGERLAGDLLVIADLNQDGFVNQMDALMLANAVLGLSDLPELPYTRVRESSPSRQESDVALTRETILRLTHPLAADTVLENDQFYAQAGGRRLLSRIELSTDRRSLTLFYMENLPSHSEVEVIFDSDGLKDQWGRPVDANGDGFPGGTMSLRFTTLSVTAVPGTAVIGRVLASEAVEGTNTAGLLDRPLEGVRITVDGMEETLFTTTDADGYFRLDPAPAGRFFVHIDGRTAKESQWPQEPYYPLVGKLWEAVAGSTNNRAGGTGVIYLPLIAPGTLQPVSASSHTPITFSSAVLQENPELEGVSITVPPNALYSDNGIRGGKVGIAPVPPDRLPSPLPAGLSFPVVITVQTDGPSNFDRPVPARFPNLPNPATAQALPPGAKSGLWSFNHDTGEWELQGSMTVSADGRFVESDPGVGIRQPGWHGSVPAGSGKGGKIRPPKEKKRCETPGQPCDDGDPCTTNDRCQGRFCKGDPPANMCPDNIPTPIHFQWSEIVHDGRETFTWLTDLDWEGEMCYDPVGQCWSYRVQSMDVEGEVHLSTGGFKEPNPMDGGNITAENYCEALRYLSLYTGHGRGRWHTLAASRAHEQYHRDVDIPNRLWPHWRIAEMTMESICIPCSVPEPEAAAIAAQEAAIAWSMMLVNYFAETAAYNEKHNREKNDAPYQVAQKILDEAAARIRQYATEKGFPLCPTQGPPPPQIHLVRLEAVVSQDLIDVGQPAQITVIGVYNDGRRVDLTAASTGTEFYSLNTNIVQVGENGQLLGLQPGLATILVTRPADGDFDLDPLLAAVTLTVRSAQDWDNDLMSDHWERAYGLNPNQASDAGQDRDGDGLANYEEYRRGTNPLVPDSDGDGLPDLFEVIEGSDPLGESMPDLTPQTGLHYYALLNLDTGRMEQRGKADSNGEAFHNLILTAKARYRQYILQAKSRLVGYSDFIGPEVGQTITLPAMTLHEDHSPDTDQDGLRDMAEMILGSRVESADSDGDGVPDGMQFLPDQYSIQVGEVIGNGLPAPGAGHIERPGVKDIYLLTVNPGQIVYLDLISNNIPCCMEWELENGQGDLYFKRPLQEGDVGRIRLEEGGAYTLTVGGGGTNQTGTYQFKFWDATPQEFDIQLGDTVTNGVPAAGAGNLETPGATDVYRFTVQSNQQVYFDFFDADSPSIPLEWRLEGESGYLASDCVRCLNPGILTFRNEGDYRLVMGNDVVPSFGNPHPETYTYGFKIWEVPPASRFDIEIGDTVTNGIPAAGAGQIETPGSQDIYSFAAAPGQQVYFQLLGEYPGLIFMGWELKDEAGNRLFDETFIIDPGVYTLTNGGTYTITVDDRQFFTTGFYQFRTYPVPPPHQFAINLGDTVREGQPGPGAGNIESPGAKDIYTFTATAGDKVSLKFLQVDPAAHLLNWEIRDQDGKEIFLSCLGCGDPDPLTLSRGGTYTMTVGERDEAWTGTYQFQITREP